MPGAQPTLWESLLPFAVIFAVFYFLIIRPQGKRLKTQEKFINELKRGDSIVTSGGILGTIDGLTDLYATIEIAPNVKVKILRKQIAASQAALQTAEKKK